MIRAPHVALAVLLSATIGLCRPTGPSEVAQSLKRQLEEAAQTSSPHPPPFKLFGAIIEPGAPPPLRRKLTGAGGHVALSPTSPAPLRPPPELSQASGQVESRATHSRKPVPATTSVPPIKLGRSRKKRLLRTEGQSVDKRMSVLQRYSSQFPPEHVVNLLVNHPSTLPATRGQPPLPVTRGRAMLRRLEDHFSEERSRGTLTEGLRTQAADRKGYEEQWSADVEEWKRQGKAASHKVEELKGNRVKPQPELIRQAEEDDLDLKAKLMMNRFHVRAWQNVDRVGDLVNQVHSHPKSLPEHTPERQEAMQRYNDRKAFLDEATAHIEREFGHRRKYPFDLSNKGQAPPSAR